jgi:hypothetical protein
MFRPVNLSLGFLNLGINAALREPTEASIVPELYGSTFTVALLGNGNDSFPLRLVPISIEEHHQIPIALHLS